MIFKYNNKVYKYTNKTFQYGNTLVFTVKGLEWPELSGSFVLSRGSTPFSITIDGGDGILYNYEAKLSGSVYVLSIIGINGGVPAPENGVYGKIVWADGQDKIRTVRITSNNFSSVKAISMRSLNLAVAQPLGIPFNLFPKLQVFQTVGGGIGGFITTLDKTLFNLPDLKTLSFAGPDFYTESIYNGYIQPGFLNPNLTVFGIAGSGFNKKLFSESRLDTISGSSLPLLETLNYSYVTVSDTGYMGQGFMPTSWYTLDKLKNLSLNAVNGFTKIPVQINNLSVTLENIFISYSSLMSFSDLSNLINLKSISLLNSSSFGTEFPDYFSANTKFKTLDLRGCFLIADTTNRIDVFIENFYAFIVTYASITGLSTLPFRGMILKLESSSVNGQLVQLPSGIYQQPEAYVQGSSNGTPLTPLEKMWVMVNQYSLTATYRTV